LGAEGELWATEVAGALGLRCDLGRRLAGPFSLRAAVGAGTATARPQGVSLWTLHAGPELAWHWASQASLAVGVVVSSFAANAPAPFAPSTRWKTQPGAALRLDYSVEADPVEFTMGLGVSVYSARRVVTLDDARVLAVPRWVGGALLGVRFGL
jgi:hypothetical protein